jgi:hypothetical protein
MANKSPPKGKRPPATIDLAATEVHVEDVKSAEPEAQEQAPSEQHLPEVIEPVPQAVFYEKPDEAAEQTIIPPEGGEAPPKQPPNFNASFDAAGAPRPEYQVPPSPAFPWAIAVAAACGGALVLFLALFFSGMMSVPGANAPVREVQVNDRVNDKATSELAFRLAKIESLLPARNETQASEAKALNDIGARIGKIETALAAPPAPDAALTSRLGALEVAVKSLGDNASGVTSRSSETADTAREARERSEATAKTLAEVKAAVDALRGNAIAKTDLDKVTDRVSAVESSTRTVEQKIETPGSTAADRDVRIAVLASSLKATVERGAPYATELAAIKPLVGDPKLIPGLEAFAASGVPSAAVLSSELVSLMPALNAAAAPSTNGGSILDRLQAGASRLVKVRPLDEAPGTDPASVLDRAEAKSMRGDIVGTIKELSGLPANVRAPADGWIARAQARSTALAAVQQISADALNALAKPAR